MGTVQLTVFETRNGSMESLCLALSLLYVRFKSYVKDGSFYTEDLASLVTQR